MSKTPEGQIQRAILDWLAAEGIWAMRLNTGAMSGSHNGKRWFVKFGKPGMADILCTPKRVHTYERKDADGDPIRVEGPVVTWLEVKTAKGNQSEAQKLFAEEVDAAGHDYFVVRSVDDVVKLLKGKL